MTAPAPPSVAVIGVGSAGSMALWALARRGVPAVGYDRYAPGHDSGAAGGESRIFRTAYKEGSGYVPVLRRALTLWRELEQATRTSLLTLCGGLTIGPPDHPDLAGVRASAAEHDLPLEQLDAVEAQHRFPQHPLTGDEVALHDPVAGVLRPERAVAAAARAAVAHGAELRTYETVTAVEPGADGVRVVSSSGSQTFDRVVWAAGPWTAPGTAAVLGVPAGTHLRQITTLWHAAERPADFAPAACPVVIRRGDHAFSAFPSLDGATVKLSMHDAEWPRLESIESLARRAPDDLVQRARRTVPTALPGLHPDPVRAGTYADAFTPDGHGLLGPSPVDDRVVLLTGFSGHGFKMAPATGEAAAALAVGDETPVDVAHLHPDRFATPTTQETEPTP